MSLHTFVEYIIYIRLFAVVIKLHLEVQFCQSDGKIIK